MPEFIGRRVGVGIAKEAARGTAEAAADYWVRHLSLELNPRAEKVMNTSAVGVLDVNSDSAVTAEFAEGSLEGKLGIDSIGLILLNLFGSVSSVVNADVSGSVYDHTFALTQSNQPPSLSLFRSDPVDDRVWPLAMFDNWELTLELGGYVRFSADVIAKSGAAQAATVAYSDETEFVVPKHATVKQANDLAGLSGASAIATVQSLTLAMNRNNERDHQFGQNDPYDITPRGREITAELVLRYDATTQEDLYLADTKQALEIAIADTDTTIGTAANPALTLTAPKVTYNDFSREDSLDDKVTQTISFTLLHDLTAGYSLQGLLTNLITAY